MKIKISFICLIIFMSFMLSSAIAQSPAGFPSPKDDYVNDFAGVINKPDTDAIRKMFKDLEYQTGIEAVVVTINSISDYKMEGLTIESFATALFNKWGVGHKKENNGVMILVSVRDKKCRIELGGGYGAQYNAAMKEIIDNKMIPYFKTGDYSRGIYEGSRAVIEAVTKKVSWFEFYKWHIIIGAIILICLAAGISCMRSGQSGWGWALFAFVAMLLFFLFKMLASGKGSSGFGGGSSFGGGASGSW